MTVHLGDHAETLTHGQIGRVYAIHHSCPESPNWLAGQTGYGDRDPMDYLTVNWVSILVHGGGAVTVPNLPEFVKRVNPFEFTNPWADMYFRNA